MTTEEKKEYNRKYYAANKEKALENRRKYYEANKEREFENRRKYYEANKEKDLANARKWRETNKEKVAEYSRKWAEANPEKAKASVKKFNVLYKAELRDPYVKQILRQQGFKSEQITPELIELKRITLKTKRLCRQLKN